MKRDLFSMTGRLAIVVLALGLVLAGCEALNEGDGGDDDVTYYSYGDTGPGGGKIFYYNPSGFFVTSESGTTGTLCHYLEAAPVPGLKAWASTGKVTTNIAGTGTNIGIGRRNTARILAADPTAPAALACKNLTTGGKSDWFLPSLDELRELDFHWPLLGEIMLEGFMHWSSSQSSNSSACSQYIDGSNSVDSSSYQKSQSFSVRAIRAF